MSTQLLPYDVFLSHSAKDKDVVRALAKQLRRDGLSVWFDEWVLKPGDNIPAKIEEALDQSRILVLCMSANAFASDWARLEAGTFRFRDPLNKERRFLPLRLDDAPIEGSLAQFLYVDWRPNSRDAEYPKLIEACRPQASQSAPEEATKDGLLDEIISLGHTGGVNSVAWSPDGQRLLSSADDHTVRLWDVTSGLCLRVFEGHTDIVWSVAWSPDGQRLLSGADDSTVRLWDVTSGVCLRVFEGHTGSVWSVAWSPDGQRLLSGAADHTVRLWDVTSGLCLRAFEGHTNRVWSVAWSPDGQRLLSGADDSTVRLWDVTSGLCLRVFEGHTDSVWSVAWSPDGQRLLSGAADHTVRLWDVTSGLCLRAFEGHTNRVLSVAWSPDGQRLLSGADDSTILLWDVTSGLCLRVFEGHTDSVWSVAWSPDGQRLLSGADDSTVRLWDVTSGLCLRVFKGHTNSVWSVAWSPDGQRLLSGAADHTVRLWDVTSGLCLRVFEGHTGGVNSVACSPDGQRLLSGADDSTVLLWDVTSGLCLRVFEGHTNSVWSVAWSPDGQRLLSGADDSTVRLWDVTSGLCLRVFEGHTDIVWSVAWSPGGQRLLSGAADNTVRLWDVTSGLCLRVFEGHTDSVWSVAWSPDGQRLLSGAADNTVRLWDVTSGLCLRVFEGHTDRVLSVAWSPDGQRLLSGAADHTVRLWDVTSGLCLRVFEGHTNSVLSVAWSPDGQRLLSGAQNGVVRIHDLPSLADATTLAMETEQVQYANAKVLLVGESGVGKTGLSNYLAHGIQVEDDKPIPSTDGAWATHWPLGHNNEKAGVEREIWLWDFAGQVDYRLVHQLFMDGTAAAVLVFNPQIENPFEALGHWDRDLQKAARKPFAKLLAAGRTDRGGLIVSAASMNKFMRERGFLGSFHETSAKTGAGCDGLRNAILDAIDWESIPDTASPALYRRMKQEILSLRDQGIVLLRLAELKQRMEMTLTGQYFKPEELDAVITLLAGPGMIQRLDFGDFVLLRPEVLSRYASAMVRQIRQHPNELGCIREDDLLAGNLDYQDFNRLPRENEAVVLRALLETLVSKAWCIRQLSDGAALLTFPSYFRRERPDAPAHPSVLVTYRFDGPSDDIYSTLVVRLHYTTAFKIVELWKSAADFQTLTGQKLGLAMKPQAEGTWLLEVYFESDVDDNSRVLFLRYVHDHLKQHGTNVVRLRHYCCANNKCEDFGAPFSDRKAIDRALAPRGKGKVFCSACGKAISLRDVIEQKFESPEMKEQSRELQAEGQVSLDNESRELILVGHTFSIVAEAGQIYRGYTNSDHGIDGEIEFKDLQGRASGKRLYIQLKSGDSYLKPRKSDGSEIFRIKEPRWADYWRQQAYTVMLVVRTSDGAIRWMDISTPLKRLSQDGQPVRQINFKGERFDAASVQRWRERLLQG